MATFLLLILMRKVDLLPPSMKDLQIFRFLKNGMMVCIKLIWYADITVYILLKCHSTPLKIRPEKTIYL
jgi:hypothetical protein